MVYCVCLDAGFQSARTVGVELLAGEICGRHVV